MCNSEGRVSQVLLYLEEICEPDAKMSDAKRRDNARNADGAILTWNGISTALSAKIMLIPNMELNKIKNTLRLGEAREKGKMSKIREAKSKGMKGFLKRTLGKEPLYRGAFP